MTHIQGLNPCFLFSCQLIFMIKVHTATYVLLFINPSMDSTKSQKKTECPQERHYQTKEDYSMKVNR